ncbi:hypothetical protein QTG54_001878 [Skeletonema marinoi]|uniref:Uncharacterized protein n=1 Tax=Skeletonema marinoi TaxID=267567 RepID=A0AAD9DJE9_9STRA|nr:hypothetical protein QTG54_001878 [Skeletonema marinoi]
MASSSDDVAHQLLGWSSDGEHAASLQSRATHDTNDNLDSFRRAVDILSSKRGQLSFGSADGDAENGMINPLLVVKGYCRLIKCSLAAAAAVDLSKDAGDLLKHLGTKLNKALQEQKIELNKQNAKSTKQNDVPSKKKKSLRNKVVLFYFKFIEDVVHAQIQKHIRLLGPTYRSVCDVAASFIALLQAEKKQMDEFVTTFLPSIGWEGLSAVHNDATKLMKVWKDANEFFGRAMLHLLSLLDTHLQKMHQALVSKQSQTSDASIETTSRVATFLLARITSLLCVMKELDQATKSNKVVASADEYSDNNDIRSMMKTILPRFVKISCFSLVAKENLEQSVDKQRALFEAIVGLGSKARNSLGKMFSRDVELSNESAINVVLDCLIEVTPKDETDNATVMDIGNETTLSLRDLFPLGRLSLANMVLGKLFTSSQTFQIKVGSMSSFCEAMLFEDVPKCYHMVASATPCSQATEVLRNFIDILESAGHFIAAKRDDQTIQSSVSTEMMHQHHVLVRWMHLSQSNPLSNELLLRAVQSRILSSCSADDQNWNHDASNLIALMSQLVFHKETDSPHRRNISIVLMRLLTPATHSRASELAKSLTIEALWREFAGSNLLSHSVLLSSNESRRKRKRKRSQNKPDESFSSSDIQIMCCVLESLASAACTSQLEIDAVAREKIKSLWEGILSRQAKSSDMKSDENDCRKLLLLSISIGLLKGTSNVVNFLRMIDVSECSATTFMEKALSYSEAQVGAVTGDEIYNSLAFNLCSSLVGAALKCTDGELSESFVSRIGKLAKCICNFAVSKSSIEAISLQRSVVQFVCNVGIQIQSGCSTQAVESLAGSISCILEKSSWYHISPNLSCLECFIKQHPSHLTLLLPASTPTSVKSLLASRVQGKIFSIVDNKVIEPHNVPYSTFQESCFLQEHCSNKRRSMLTNSCFGSESCPRCNFCLARKKTKN